MNIWAWPGKKDTSSSVVEGNSNGGFQFSWVLVDGVQCIDCHGGLFTSLTVRIITTIKQEPGHDPEPEEGNMRSDLYCFSYVSVTPHKVKRHYWQNNSRWLLCSSMLILLWWWFSVMQTPGSLMSKNFNFWLRIYLWFKIRIGKEKVFDSTETGGNGINPSFALHCILNWISGLICTLTANSPRSLEHCVVVGVSLKGAVERRRLNWISRGKCNCSRLNNRSGKFNHLVGHNLQCGLVRSLIDATARFWPGTTSLLRGPC